MYFYLEKNIILFENIFYQIILNNIKIKLLLLNAEVKLNLIFLNKGKFFPLFKLI